MSHRRSTEDGNSSDSDSDSSGSSSSSSSSSDSNTESDVEMATASARRKRSRSESDRKKSGKKKAKKKHKKKKGHKKELKKKKKKKKKKQQKQQHEAGARTAMLDAAAAGTSAGAAGTQLAESAAVRGTPSDAMTSVPAKVQRESWMTTPMASGWMAAATSKREAAEAAAAQAAEAEEKARQEKLDKLYVKTDPTKHVDESAFLVGDGGASWRQRAMKRARGRGACDEDAAGGRSSSSAAAASSASATSSSAPASGSVSSSHAPSASTRSGSSADDSAYRKRFRHRLRGPDEESQADSLSWRRLEGIGHGASTTNETGTAGGKRHTSVASSGTLAATATATATATVTAASAFAFAPTCAPVQPSVIPTPVAAPPVMTEEELNALAAKAMRAKVMGKMAKYEKLQARVDAARNAIEDCKRIVVLSGLDAKGRPIGMLPRERAENEAADEYTDPDGTVRGKKRKRAVIVDGERKGFFQADLDDKDLDTLVREERLGVNDDADEAYARRVLKNSHLRDQGLEEQFDTLNPEQYESTRNRLSSKARQEYDRNRAISAHRLHEEATKNCYYCFASPKLQKHMVLHAGSKLYLAVPTRTRIVDEQCLIVPMDHIGAVTDMDEEQYEELQSMKKLVVDMFATQNKGVVFLETVFKRKKTRHATIHCIPLERDMFQDAPLYFRKSLLESDEQWSVHKKIIDTREKGIMRSIAKGFPYFSVDFGLQGGFAHVIEDENQFPEHFGQEIVCGILEEPAQMLLRARRESRAQEVNRARRVRAVLDLVIRKQQ